MDTYKNSQGKFTHKREVEEVEKDQDKNSQKLSARVEQYRVK